MDRDKFNHLHVHTKYSTKDGAIKLEPLAKKCKENGMTACAITDHGNMNGAIDFYNTMKKHNIKPIIGYESYTKVTDNVASAIEKQGKALNVIEKDLKRDMKNHHLILLAKNNEGYKNLLQLVSQENNEGLVQKGKFAKGNLDLDWVKANGLGKGIIALTACLGSTTCKLLQYGLLDMARQFAIKLSGIFEETYVELQDNTTKDQAMINFELIKLAQDTNLPLVLTKDAHYLNKEDYNAHDALLGIQMNQKLDSPDKWRFPGGPDYYIATPDEMEKFCIDNNIPLSAMYNTVNIAEKCNVYLFDEGNHKGVYGGSLFPDFPNVPVGYTQDTYLRKLAMDGLIDFIRTRPKGYPMNVKEYTDRLNYELDIICSMGYSGYFLILWDFMLFCKNYRDPTHPRGIGTGTGRGSGVGSLVCRSLNITKVDPIKYNLLFERFLNPERKSEPDVDLDVSDLDRHLVIEYLKDTYGVDRVGQIITFGEIKVAGGTRTLLRLKDLKKKEQDAVCKYVEASFPDQKSTDLNTLLDLPINPDNYKDRFGQKFDHAYKIAESFNKAIAPFPWLVEYLKVLEGCIEKTGAHAGGVLLFPDNARKFVPTNAPSGKAVVPVSQYNMDIIGLLQILKIDVLGLTTSRITSRTADKVIDLFSKGATTGKHVTQKLGIDINNINYEDPKVFEMLRNGHTVDVFQFGSPGMTKMLIDMSVDSIEKLIAGVSLFRPGPLDAIDEDTGMTIYETYINCLQTGVPKKVHPRLEPILRETMGNIVYQEQVMQVVMEMAGCTLGYADIVRRACAKKKAKLMKQIGIEFKYGKREMKKVLNEQGEEEEIMDINGAYILKPNGDPVIKGAIHNGFTEEEADKVWKMIKAFAAYAFNKSHAAAYAIIAYQTAYLKYYYPAEYMSEVLTAHDNDKDIAKSIKECKRLGVPILPPSVNKSGTEFTVETLPDGRKGIRFGLQAISGIKNAQPITDIQPATSVADFFERVNCSIINKSKATNLILAGAFDEFELNRHKLHNYYFDEIRKDKPVDPQTFAKLKEQKKHNTSYIPKNEKKFNDDIKFDYEKELMGIYASGHPLDKFPYRAWNLIGIGEAIEQTGILRKVNIRQDRYGRAYAFFKFECLEDIREGVMWATEYAKFGDKLLENKTVILRGTKKTDRNGNPQLVANQLLVRLNSVNNKNNNRVNANANVQMPSMDNPTNDLFEQYNANDIIYGNCEIEPQEDLSQQLFGNNSPI